MSDRPPRHPPIAGDRLEKAIQEMRQPAFFKRLVAVVRLQSGTSGLLRGDQLPGGKACDDIAVEIVDAVLKGRRQWKVASTFFGACESAVRSQVDNWKKKAQNAFEWSAVTVAVEDWEDSSGGIPFPAHPNLSPPEQIIRAEVLARQDEEKLELAGMVEAGTLDEAIVTEILETGGASSRAQMVDKLGCPGEEYDAAMKRIKRLAEKIKIRRKE